MDTKRTVDEKLLAGVRREAYAAGWKINIRPGSNAVFLGASIVERLLDAVLGQAVCDPVNIKAVLLGRLPEELPRDRTIKRK
jgi:hypothetical protein